MTELLQIIKKTPSCSIQINKDTSSWNLECNPHHHSKAVVVNVLGKTFTFDTTDNCMKLSGPGSDSLNLMLRYILQQLNGSSTNNDGKKQDERIEQRCKTINKKISQTLPDNFDFTKVPIDFLISVYENCINSIPIDKSTLKIPLLNNNTTSRSRRRSPSHHHHNVDTNVIKPTEFDDEVFKSSMPDGFCLLPSKYVEFVSGKKGEYGLFTRFHIKKNEFIGEYKGVLYPKSAKKLSYDDLYNKYFHEVKHVNAISYALKNKNYEIEVDDNIIDASIQNKSSFIRYINSGFPDYFMNNCAYVEEKKRVFLIALRNIEVGEELLCSYGVNTENNINHKQIKKIKIIEIPSIPSDEKMVTYDETCGKENAVQKTQKLGEFVKRYYELLVQYLREKKKYGTYTKYLESKKLSSSDKKYRYTGEECSKNNNNEYKSLMDNIKNKLTSIKDGSRMTPLQETHYTKLKEYYEKNKKKVV